jgi:hypothetical protein
MISNHRFGTFTLDGVFRAVATRDAFWRASLEGVKAALEGGNSWGVLS